MLTQLGEVATALETVHSAFQHDQTYPLMPLL
jgi:hypothetical protein